MGTIIAVCILSAGIGVALGYWIKTLKYWHDMETGSLAKDSISDKNMSDLKDEITRLELENKKLEEENENLKKKSDLINKKSIQKHFDEFCAKYKSDAIAKIRVKAEDGVKEFICFTDEETVTKLMQKTQDAGCFSFGRIQSKVHTSSEIYNGFSYFKEYYDEYYWCDKLVKPQDHAIDWKITTMYIKLADLESIEIEENMEAYI
ncbi:hypothetical protein [Lactobacillus johnsonii]|uniref:hypothetical protein n=1 Tax=Lactobacillus johnsonii TaxID=33959 RepID=UPI001FB399C7|nr:hypothetical protein [Lactobacillus johnsonii]UOC05466.1 hypothetical protein LC811_06430 [Lactobacillus johnsonii]